MAQPGSGSSRTPFDNDLVNDPHAPRDTQPLTPRAAIPANPAPANPASPPHNPAARNLPPQVVTRTHDDDAAPSITPPNNPTKRLPTSTLIGFALAGGALGVLLLSMLVRSVLPGPANKIVYTPEDAPPAPPRVAVQRPAAQGQSGATTQPDTATSRPVEETTSAEITIDEPRASGADRLEESVEPSDGGTVTSETARESGRIAENSPSNRSGSGDAQTQSRLSTGRDERDTDSESSIPRDTASNGDSGGASSTRDKPRDTGSRNGVNSSGRRYSSRRGYAIIPPAGYKLQRSGRRTVWRGPGGEQILVETGSTNGTPREGWERLDKALSRKYGSKYRNRGIRETTLAGKPAAVWEFEIDTPRGTQRKIDIAVHHGGRGYAILGEAPANRFEDARPRIEAAIQSFELQRRREEASSTRSTSRRDDDDAVENRSRRSGSVPRAETRNNRDDSGDVGRRNAESDDDNAAPVRSEGY